MFQSFWSLPPHCKRRIPSLSGPRKGFHSSKCPFSLSQLQTNHSSLQAKYSDMKKTLTEVSICPLLPYCDLRAHSLLSRVRSQRCG